MKNKQLIILVLLLIYIVSIKAQNPISLSIIKKEGTGFTLKEIEKEVFEVTTTTGNATVQFAPLTTALPGQMTVLSFDYFCATGLEFLVVAVNDDYSHLGEELIRMPIAEGWSTFSTDISAVLKRLTKPDDHLSLLIVPNTAGPTVMRIKSPVLRVYSEKELNQANEKIARENREKRMDQDIAIYLNKHHACQVTNVKVAEKNVTINGDIKGMKGEIFLCEAPMFSELTEKEFLTTRKVSESSNFMMTFDRYADVDGQMYDRIYSRWVLAQRTSNGYTICSHGRYPDEVEALYDLPHETVRTKKGIGGFRRTHYETDIDDLQATSVTVNMFLGFMQSTPSENTIAFEYNGKTYYADKNAIHYFDSVLQYTASKDLIVSAIVLIPPERGFEDKVVGKLFEHPDFDPAGIFTMPNMTTPESLNLYAAAMDFLASRYSRPDKKFGRIHHWIAHNEVNSGWVWTNAGIKTALRFMDIYHKSMRLLYYTARKYNPHSETLITLEHNWEQRYNEYCFTSAQLLDMLIDFTAAEGDFKWGLAYHPYPQNLFEPKAWLDDMATFDIKTKKITFKNLEVLDAWIKQPRALYKGVEKRTLYLSEQNPNSKDYSEEALTEQAAGMAYALKKMEACTGIDAYQMHAWFDNRGEGGLRIGIRRFTDDETDPGGRKPSWYVFEAFGTDKEAETFEFAKKIIGIDDWDQIIYKAPIPLESP